jgi:hypothetical protein
MKKDGPFWELQVESFEDIRKLIEVDINNFANINEYVFRGQSNENWPLSSTLYRLIKNAGLIEPPTMSKEDYFSKWAKDHLERFRLEIRGRRGDNPPKLREDELWSLGQHFGLATPLLDWTASPYISIFFALAGINEDGNSRRALWCLHKPQVKQINSQLPLEQNLKFIVPETEDNKRLLGQSGLFTKGPVFKTVNEWVKSPFISYPDPTKPVLLKVTFPGDSVIRKNTLKKLQLMNINHSTLFPDLSGASQHCNILAEDHEMKI